MDTILDQENENLETPEKRNFKARAGAFFDRYYALFFAPIFALVAYAVALFNYGVWPFGDKYTAASYDLSAQICPFIEHLFDVLQGKSSLTYSYAIAGGADVTGTFLYFFISPFSFIFLLFGDGMVAHASSIVTGLKVATIAFAGTWFAYKLFKNIPDYIRIVVGLAYAYCGYTFVACTYINWMDFLIWLPFAVVAFVRFVKTGKFLPFACLLACCIYTCFSIACFSMFVVFPALVFYGLLCVEKSARNRYLTRLALAFFTAILMSLPVLLPALSAYTVSGRGGGLFEDFWYGFSEKNGELGSFNATNFLDRFGEAYYRKWSYILSDSVFLLLTLVWFFRTGLKDNFAKFMLVAGVFTLVPVVVDEATLLMNMGSYMSYALRFGFLNAIYFLGGACLALDGICWQEKLAYDGRPLKGFVAPVSMENHKENGGMVATNTKKPLFPFLKNASVWTVVFLIVSVVCIAFLFWYISGDNYHEIWTPFYSGDKDMLDSLRSFSPRYAHSLGGAEVVAVLFGVVAVVSLLGFVCVGARRLDARFVSYILVVVVGLQLIFYNNQLVLGNRSTQHIELGAYREICETLTENDDSYFRVKDYSDDLTANAPFTGGANAFSVFSSVIDKDNFEIYHLFGYEGNGKNSLKSAHNHGKLHRNEPFGDSFLGYKYAIVPEGEKDEFESDSDCKHFKPYTVSGKHYSVGGYFVYENTWVFPNAYKVSGGAFKFVEENIANSTNRRKNQLALYEYLYGQETSSISNSEVRALQNRLQENAAEVVVGAGKITAKTTAESGEYLFLPFVASKGYEVRVNGVKTDLVENDLHFLCVPLADGENTVVFEYKSPYALNALFGALAGIAGLLVTAFVLKKTKIESRLSGVVASAGILLVSAIVAFFMIFPTAVWLVKLAMLIP